MLCIVRLVPLNVTPEIGPSDRIAPAIISPATTLPFSADKLPSPMLMLFPTVRLLLTVMFEDTIKLLPSEDVIPDPSNKPPAPSENTANSGCATNPFTPGAAPTDAQIIPVPPPPHRKKWPIG